MRAAIYARFSSDNQRVESIDAQVRAINQYCLDNDLLVVKQYTDEALSGTSDQRDSFLEMIRDSERGLFDVVIVHKLDRFARNRYDSAIYRKKLADNNVKLISVLERIDEDNPENIILLSVLEGMNEYYSKNLAREVRKGQKENALKGIHNGGIPPLGFNVDPETRKLVINEVEAEAVRIIFDMYCRKYGYDLISKELNSKGYKTKTGKAFTRNSIAEILRNEKYIGRYVFNKRLSKKSGNRKYKDDKDIVRIDGAFPSIVSMQVWERKEEILKTRLKPRRNCSRHFILTGKVICSCCNGNYVGSSTWSGRNKKKYYQYESMNRKRKINNCKNKVIRAELLEEYVIKELQTNVFNEEVIDIIANNMLSIISNKSKGASKTLIGLKNKQKTLQSKIDKMLDLYLEGNLSKTALESKTESIQQELENVVLRINEYTSNNVGVPTIENIKKYLYNMRNDLINKDTEVKQTVIDTFVDKVVIGSDSVEVLIKISPLAVDKNSNIYVYIADTTDGDGSPLSIYASINKADLIPKYKS